MTLLAATLLAAAGSASAAPPVLSLEIQPRADCMGVAMTFANPHFANGEAIVRRAQIIVGIPVSPLEGNALVATDKRGSFPLVAEAEPATPQGRNRIWRAGRASEGDVTFRYCSQPRAVTASTNNGPLFDLRLENGGFIGAGVGFLLTPVREQPFEVRLHWDLSQAPAGSRGVWSMAGKDGDAIVTLPAEAMTYSFFAVGPLQAIEDDKFGMYWLSQPNFSGAELARRVQILQRTMAEFFHSEDGKYRVFIRQNPYNGTGGTALPNAFSFGYNPAEGNTIFDMQSTISHEIAHNWPAMEGEHGDTAWYSEGAAEYYAMILAYRAGLLPIDTFLKDANRRAAAYYTNPYRDLSNTAAAKIFWTDPTAQTVPYGRGFVFLLRTDEAIRKASGGARSLDTVVLELLRRQRAGQPYGIDAWLELVGKEIGGDRARREYEAMASGAILDLPPTRFGPCLRIVRATEHIFELGFDRSSLNDERVVHGLAADSAAAKAGLRDGDVISFSTPIRQVRDDEAVPMTIRFRRDGTERTIRFKPRGKAVSAWRWQRVRGTPEGKCGL